MQSQEPVCSCELGGFSAVGSGPEILNPIQSLHWPRRTRRVRRREARRTRDASRASTDAASDAASLASHVTPIDLHRDTTHAALSVKRGV